MFHDFVKLLTSLRTFEDSPVSVTPQPTVVAISLELVSKVFFGKHNGFIEVENGTGVSNLSKAMSPDAPGTLCHHG